MTEYKHDQMAYGGGAQDSSRVGRWMQTRSGAQFWPLDPRPEEIDIRDIAAAISKQCRYGGHCKKFYSVAEHCVNVAAFARSEHKLTALMHDSSEGYLVDIPRPVKQSLLEYLTIEKRLEEVIATKFGLIFPWPPEVKELDNRILRDEMEQLMAAPIASWNLTEPALGIELACWEPKRAEEQFLSAFYAYGGRP